MVLKKYIKEDVFYLERYVNNKLTHTHAFKCFNVYASIDKKSYRQFTEKVTPQLNEAIEIFCKELKNAGWTHVDTKQKLLEALNIYKVIKKDEKR